MFRFHGFAILLLALMASAEANFTIDFVETNCSASLSGKERVINITCPWGIPQPQFIDASGDSRSGLDLKVGSQIIVNQSHDLIPLNEDHQAVVTFWDSYEQEESVEYTIKIQHAEPTRVNALREIELCDDSNNCIYSMDYVNDYSVRYDTIDNVNNMIHVMIPHGLSFNKHKVYVKQYSAMDHYSGYSVGSAPSLWDGADSITQNTPLDMDGVFTLTVKAELGNTREYQVHLVEHVLSSVAELGKINGFYLNDKGSIHVSNIVNGEATIIFSLPAFADIESVSISAMAKDYGRFVENDSWGDEFSESYDFSNGQKHTFTIQSEDGSHSVKYTMSAEFEKSLLTEFWIKDETGYHYEATIKGPSENTVGRIDVKVPYGVNPKTMYIGPFSPSDAQLSLNTTSIYDLSKPTIIEVSHGSEIGKYELLVEVVQPNSDLNLGDITLADNTTNSYTIVKSNYLQTNSTDIVATFDYGSDLSNLSIMGIENVSNQNIVYDNVFDLSNGKSVPILVVSSDGLHQRTYNLYARVLLPSSSAQLKQLTICNTSLTHCFDSRHSDEENVLELDLPEGFDASALHVQVEDISLGATLSCDPSMDFIKNKEYQVTVTAEDGITQKVYTLRAIFPNKAPQSIKELLLEDQKEDFKTITWELNEYFADSEGDQVNYIIIAMDGVLAKVQNSTLILEPLANYYGLASFELLVMDDNVDSRSASFEFQFLIQPMPDALKSSRDTLTVPLVVNESFSPKIFDYSGVIQDVDGDAVYSCVAEPADLVTVDCSNFQLTISSVEGKSGAGKVVIKATNSFGSVSLTQEIVVQPTGTHKIQREGLNPIQDWREALMTQQSAVTIYHLNGRRLWQAPQGVHVAEVERQLASNLGVVVLRIGRQQWVLPPAGF